MEQQENRPAGRVDETVHTLCHSARVDRLATLANLLNVAKLQIDMISGCADDAERR
jgi:hypothetical protein